MLKSIQIKQTLRNESLLQYFSGSIQVHTILSHLHNFPIQKEIRYSANSLSENFHANTCRGGLINTFLVHGQADIQNQHSFLQFVIVCSRLHTIPNRETASLYKLLFSKKTPRSSEKRCSNPIKPFEALWFWHRVSGHQPYVCGSSMMGVH